MAWEARIDSPVQVAVLVLCAIFIPIAPAVVGLRLWARKTIRTRLLWSDYLILLSCVTLLPMWPPIILLFAGGGGSNWPLEARPFSFWVMRVECLVISSSIYLLSSYLCRLSILCIYNEFLGPLPWMRTTIRVAAAWVILCALVSLGVQLGVGIQDIHFVLADLGPDAQETGIKWTVYGILPDVLSCVCDFLITALPLHTLWSLRMRDQRRKVALIATFMVGFVACGIALVRILAWKLPTLLGIAPSDPLLQRDAFEILYPIETTFGLLGANLPMMRLFMRREDEAPRSSLRTYEMEPLRRSPVLADSLATVPSKDKPSG